MASRSSRSCDFCGKPSKSVCAKCKTSCFCSVEHQRLMWKFHKLVCVQSTQALNNSSSIDFFRMPGFIEEERDVLIEYANTPRHDGYSSPLAHSVSKYPPSQIISNINEALDTFPEGARSQYLCDTRQSISDANSGINQLIEKVPSIGPTYLASKFWTGLQESTSTYSYAYHREKYLHECRVAIWFGNDTEERTIYLSESLEKLELMVQDLEKNGMDRSGYYRSRFNLDQEHIIGISLLMRGEIDKEERNRRYLEASKKCT